MKVTYPVRRVVALMVVLIVAAVAWAAPAAAAKTKNDSLTISHMERHGLDYDRVTDAHWRLTVEYAKSGDKTTIKSVTATNLTMASQPGDSANVYIVTARGEFKFPVPDINKGGTVALTGAASKPIIGKVQVRLAVYSYRAGKNGIALVRL